MKNIGAVFSGQGGQYSGMCNELFLKYPETRMFFEKASDIVGINLVDICLNANDEILMKTEISQLVTVVYSVALFEVFKKKYGFSPKYYAGHSVGEYSALICSDFISFEDGIKLVKKRGELMSKVSRKGSMLAVLNNDPFEVELYCCNNKDNLVIDVSNYNSKKQTILSGDIEKIKEAKIYFENNNVIVKELKVSGAFHSSLMKEIEEEFECELSNCTFHVRENCQVYSNVDALPYLYEMEIREKLKKQLSSPVIWTEVMRSMRKNLVDYIVEFSVKKTVCTFFKDFKDISTFLFYEDIDDMDKYLNKDVFQPIILENFINDCLSIIACTKNHNFDNESYEKHVIESTNELRKIKKINFEVNSYNTTTINEIIFRLKDVLEGKNLSLKVKNSILKELIENVNYEDLKERLKNLHLFFDEK